MKTKYITILIITIFLSTIQLMGQCQEDIEIKTHPSNAVNDELDENHPVQSLYIPTLVGACTVHTWVITNKYFPQINTK